MGGSVKLEISGLTDPGRARSNDEIVRAGAPLALTQSRDALLLVVSGGMGGASSGEVASALTVEALREHVASAVGTAADGDALRAGIAHANEVVCAAAAASRERAGMGAPVVAALVRPERVSIVVVGAARAYLFRAGRLVQLTRDQSLVQSLLDAGVLTAEQAATHPHRTTILQAIGSAEALEPRRLGARGVPRRPRPSVLGRSLRRSRGRLLRRTGQELLLP